MTVVGEIWLASVIREAMRIATVDHLEWPRGGSGCRIAGPKVGVLGVSYSEGLVGIPQAFGIEAALFVELLHVEDLVEGDGLSAFPAHGG